MTNLRAEDFDAYFSAVHGTGPFPWQSRLLRQVVERGWPAALDLPTGTGKTAVLDIALFHLALEAASERRRAPVRIVLVVDRRTVVDQAFDRSNKIKDALKSPSTPVLRLMRQALARLSGDEDEPKDEPLALARLRGGIARDDDWARSPAQPLVAVSTVDQVGSRLLFRGYGVSRSMRPIHAGLLANDTLIVLDEVHLAEPFRQTLTALAERYRGWAERRLPDRWHVVSMSATSSVDAPDRFTLDDADRSHPVLRRRLEARKPVRLIEVKVPGDDATRTEKFADRLAEAASPPAHMPGAAIAVVVNRVRTARLVFERVQRAHGEIVAAHLLTGRMRPLDREEIEDEIKQRVGAGRTPRVPSDGKPTIVVATQCIEAGADFDFDVLITECASFDALKQRFGRLNRFGDAQRCFGAVLMRSDGSAEEDPIYGRALKDTWAFLKKRADEGREDHVDFGIDALDVPANQTQPLIGRLADAPVLLPAHLDTWVQTSRAPDPDPDVSLWLHGLQAAEPEVQIVWRADIDRKLLEESATSTGSEARERLLECVEVCPPRSGEALGIPLSAARRWLAGSSPDDISDMEGLGTRGEEDEPRSRRPALVWRGERSAVVYGDRGAIEPGDTLIVPSEYGGLLHRNWAPGAESHQPVSDLGDRVASQAGGRSVLRLHEAVWRSNLGALAAAVATTASSPPRPPEAENGDGEEEEDRLDAWLKDVKQLTLPKWLSEIVGGFTNRRRRRIVRLSGGGQPPLSDENASPASHESYYCIVARARTEGTTEEEVSSFTGVAVPLRAHLAGVASFARTFALRCGLPPEIVVAIETAGQWHDIGKADPRFQRLLHGGNAFEAAVAREPIAKSALPPTDRRARIRARQRSGYPDGCRHELMSVALMLRNLPAFKVSGELDLDLVLHLVSSHHGWCRPLAPFAIDHDPVDVEFAADGSPWRARSNHALERLDSGVTDRFFRLVRRYGWFGLAWLEAILRLADHRRSEWEQTSGDGVRG